MSVTLLMGAGILTEAALGFLGFGVQAPQVSLGTLVSDYDGAYSSRPWLFLWPGVFVVAIVLCLQFIGDGLRDAFDPRQKRIPKRKDLEPSRLARRVATTLATSTPRPTARSRRDLRATTRCRRPTAPDRR